MNNKKIQLPDVTLIGIDCVNVDRLCRAAIQSLKGIDFGEVKILSSLIDDFSNHNISFVNIPELKSRLEYTIFVMTELVKHVNTDYMLIFQHDGYVLNPDAWDDEFFNYDYIGAKWFFHPERKVGNGGFSLRSKRLMQRVSEIPYYECYDRKTGELAQEDAFICRVIGQQLEEEGFRFAPEEIADRFSIENGIWTGEFGFHDPKITLIPERFLL